MAWYSASYSLLISVALRIASLPLSKRGSFLKSMPTMWVSVPVRPLHQCIDGALFVLDRDLFGFRVGGRDVAFALL